MPFNDTFPKFPDVEESVKQSNSIYPLSTTSNSDSSKVPNLALPDGCIYAYSEGFTRLETMGFGIIIDKSKDPSTGKPAAANIMEQCHKLDDTGGHKYRCSVRDHHRSAGSGWSFGKVFLFTVVVDNKYRVSIFRFTVNPFPLNITPSIASMKQTFDAVINKNERVNYSRTSIVEILFDEIKKQFPLVSFSIFCSLIGSTEVISDMPSYLFKKKVEDDQHEIILVVERQRLHSLHLIRGKDKGKPAWHYVLVEADKYYKLKKKKTGENIEVENFGKIVKSGWGTDPSDEIKEQMTSQYED